MKYRSSWWLVLASALVCGACASMHDTTDPKFQHWLSQAEASCTSRYGALSFDIPGQRAEFEKLSYQTYYRDLPQEVYADRLRILYPNNRLTVDCLANSFPEW